MEARRCLGELFQEGNNKTKGTTCLAEINQAIRTNKNAKPNTLKKVMNTGESNPRRQSAELGRQSI
jgi:hypothetical protein